MKKIKDENGQLILLEYCSNQPKGVDVEASSQILISIFIYNKYLTSRRSCGVGILYYEMGCHSFWGQCYIWLLFGNNTKVLNSKIINNVMIESSSLV